MFTVIVTFFLLIVILFDFLPLRKSLSVKETVLYCVSLLIGFSALMLYGNFVELPGITGVILRAVGKLFSKSS